MRQVRCFLVTCAFTLGAARTSFAVDKEECIEAHVDAQRLRKEGKLVAASERVLTCASEECPKVLRTECLSWHEEIEASVPTIVLAVMDSNGNDVSAVRVLIDGEVIAEQLDGKAIRVDPGAHQLRFEVDGADAILRDVLVREGERNKKVEVSFESAQRRPAVDAPEPVPEEETFDAAEPVDGTSSPVLAYLLGGVGVGALGGATFFWLSSESDVGDLEDSGCAPACPTSEVDGIRQKRLIGDVLLGVGVASLGVAGYLLATQSKDDGRVSATLPAADVALLPGGAMATARGRWR